MTDSELIAEARARWNDDPRAGPLLLALAARLEALTAPAGGSPLSATRESRLRESRKRQAGTTHADDLRDLLAALDWERARRVQAEGVIQDMYAESARHEAGVREGVARALGVIQAVADRSNNLTERMHLGCVAGAVAVSCGPALLPQHAVTHARLVRLEAALGEMVRQMDGSSVFASRLCRIAREALGGEP